jgi:RimJ/RimL family protein N-acetyltransferase
MAKPDYPVRTERLLLRPFEPDDLDALHSWQSRPDVARFLYWEARSRDEAREALAKKMATTWPEDEGDVLALAVQRQDTGEVIGDVNLEWLSEEHEQGEFGFVFHPDHHGRGYATEAARAVLRLGFANLGLHRIIGRCDARNDGSFKLMERLGMRREAHFRHADRFKGEWGEEYVYAILADEVLSSPAG